MAPLPPNNTGRYFFDYSVGSIEHTGMIRANAVVSPAAMGTQIDNLMNALAPGLFVTTFVRLRWAPSGSNITTPVTSGFEGTTWGAGTPTADDIPSFLDFVGRSVGGRRCRFALFTHKFGLSGYRITTGENTTIALALPNIQLGANSWLAIDNTKPVWYPYVDTGFNAYWQREVRS